MKHLIIICGPSGVGKTTVQNYLQKEYHIPKVITHTTRPPRKGEINGKDYYFETPLSFAQKHYFENVRYANYDYGSSEEALKLAWQHHDLVSLIVDTKGTLTYLHKLKKQVIVIYLQVSDNNELKKRMLKRGDDPQEVDERFRSKTNQRDLQLPSTLNAKVHVIFNDNWQQTKRQLAFLIGEIKK